MKYFKIYGRESCPWCCKACNLLKSKKIDFMFCEMGSSPSLIEHFKDQYDMTTVPIVVKVDDTDETMIGGCVDLFDYFNDSTPVENGCLESGCEIKVED